jgi:hypothetical protein
MANVNSFTLAWPTGTLLGDLAIIFVAAGYGPSALPTGWTSLYEQTAAANINGLVAWKILNSADITAGSVTVNLLGTSPGGAEIITLVRTPAILECDGDQRVSVITDAISTSGIVPAGSLALYFGAGRANGFNPHVTVNRGTLLQSHSDTDFCTCLYSESLAAGLTASFNFSVAASVLDAVVIIGSPPFIGPQGSLDTLMTSDTAPAPYAASSNAEIGLPELTAPGETTAGNAFNAFSNLYATDSTVSWLGEFDDTHAPTWLAIDLGRAEILDGYAIKIATGFPAIMTPRDWMLQGSADQTLWITVDTQSSQTAWTSGTAGLRKYSISAPPVGFRYWRLNVTANNSGDDSPVPNSRATNVGVGSLLLYEWRQP